MTDPTTDPRAADLIAAVPDDVSILSTTLSKASDESQYTANGLRAAAHDTQWQGKSADAFRASIGVIPTKLDAVSEGYGCVARALLRYEPELAEYQSAYRRLVPQLDDAGAKLNTAATNLSNAETTYNTAVATPGTSTATLTKEYNAVLAAQKAVESAADNLSALQKRALTILDDFDVSRTKCANGIIAAGYLAAPKDGGILGPDTVQIGTIMEKSLGNWTPVRIDPLAPGNGGRGSGSGPTKKPGGGTGPTIPTAGGKSAPPPASAAAAKVNAMLAAVHKWMGEHYSYGGGHGGTFGPSEGTEGLGLDCSGFVSIVLHAAGYLPNGPLNTQGLAAAGFAQGPGQYVTIWDRTNGSNGGDHVIIEICGVFYEEGGGSIDGGAGDVHQFNPTPAYLASFNDPMHPPGL